MTVEEIIKKVSELCRNFKAKEVLLYGTSAKFSITFDLAWKVMKDILIQYYAITGFVAGSPREVLRESFKTNIMRK